MKKITSILGQAIDRIQEWVGKSMALLVLPLLVLTFFGVLQRYVFKAPTEWNWQVLLLLFIPLATLPFGYVLQKNAHIRLDLLYSRWTPKGKAISDLCTFVVFLLFTSILTFALIEAAWHSISFREVYSFYTFKGPIYPKKIIMAVSFVLLAIQGIVGLIRNIGVIRSANKKHPSQ